jgi:hypothetical protein
MPGKDRLLRLRNEWRLKMARRKEPKPFKVVTRMTLSLERTDGFTETEDNEPLLKALYLDEEHNLMAEAPCGSTVMVAMSRAELDAIRSFLEQVAEFWQTLPD